MNLQTPTVGPILGHTTPSQARLFLRGEAEPKGEGLNRCFAVVRYRPATSDQWSAPLYNKMSPNFDVTAVIVLEGLTADTEYRYQAAWFYAEQELEEVRLTPAESLQWLPAEYTLRTATSDTTKPRSYMVGSCRYMLRLFDENFFDDRGDKPFRAIIDQLATQPVHGLMMVGDQIYADDLNLVLPDNTALKYLKRYRAAFSQPNIREAMAQIPSYMVLDDHEIEDNWPAKATDKNRITLYPNAMAAYQIYQCSHSPLYETTTEGRITGTLEKYWYCFSDGCADWFVMDVRTERQPGARKMIEDEQMEALLSWLGDGSGKVKLVVSSVMFFPDMKSDGGDTWKSFAEQRLVILERIRTLKLKKVAFISGDVHCSMTSRLTCSADPAFSVISVVSSSFFWPLPHFKASGFQLDQQLAEATDASYSSSQLTPVHSTDNFARLDVSPQGLGVTYYDRKGTVLGESIKLDW